MLTAQKWERKCKSSRQGMKCEERFQYVKVVDALIGLNDAGHAMIHGLICSTIVASWKTLEVKWTNNDSHRKIAWMCSERIVGNSRYLHEVNTSYPKMNR